MRIGGEQIAIPVCWKVTGCLIGLICFVAELKLIASHLYYIIDQGSPCPLATLSPFGRELLLLDVFIGFKRSTWIKRSIIIINMNMNIIINMTMNMTINMTIK
jgi:hypothetical protein